MANDRASAERLVARILDAGRALPTDISHWMAPG